MEKTFDFVENPNERWEKGMPHNSKSEELYKFISKLDGKYGDFFDFKSGGDGDNGEQLMYLLDVYFEKKEKGVI